MKWNKCNVRIHNNFISNWKEGIFYSKMSCKKCDLPKTVTLRKKDYYCDECFMTNTNHKFRACLGKNKVLSRNENVLICLSGGPGSAVLLDLVHYGISLDNNKMLRIIPKFLHLYDDKNKETAAAVINQCKKYNFRVYVVHLSDYMKANMQLPDTDCVPSVDQTESSKFYELLNSLPSTAANDFLSKVKRSLYIKYAEELLCSSVFTAETTNTLAINLLSNIAIGRGSQVESDVGFSDTCDENIKILRPMRDISEEELYYYIKTRQISPVCDNKSQSHSLQSVIKLFVEDLQENFQSTISTVCKTADKMGVCDEHQSYNKCLICGNTIHMKNYKLSALEATNFSRTVSLDDHDKSYEGDLRVLEHNDVHTTMFPFIHKHLCYACSRNYSEMDQSKLPQHVQTLFMDS